MIVVDLYKYNYNIACYCLLSVKNVLLRQGALWLAGGAESQCSAWAFLFQPIGKRISMGQKMQISLPLWGKAPFYYNWAGWLLSCSLLRMQASCICFVVLNFKMHSIKTPEVLECVLTFGFLNRGVSSLTRVIYTANDTLSGSLLSALHGKQYHREVGYIGLFWNLPNS